MVLLAGLVAAALVSGLSVADAVADPQETTDQRFLGIVSNVGILFWAAAVTVCLFAAFAVDGEAPSGRAWRRFLVASAALTLMLLIDDFLLVHEFGDDVARWFVDFEPTRGRKDLIESIVFCVYGMIVLAYGWRFRDRLRRLDRRALVAAVALLGLSLAVDMGLLEVAGIELSDGSDGPDVASLVEEGPKFGGIVFLVVFYARAAGRAIAESGVGGGARVAGIDRGPGAGDAGAGAVDEVGPTDDRGLVDEPAPVGEPGEDPLAVPGGRTRRHR